MRSAPGRGPARLAVLLIVAGLLGPAAARAEEQASLDRAEELLAAQSFRQAYGELHRLLEGGGLSPEELRRVYLGLTEAAAAERRPGETRDAFLRLLALDPDFALPSLASPLLRAPFEAAREFWEDQRRPSLGFRPPARYERGAAVVIEPDLEPGAIPELSSSLALFVQGEEGDFETLEPAEGRFEVPQALLQGQDELTFYLVARDEHGNTTMSVGTAAEPLRVPLGAGRRRAPRRSDLVRSWWFWVAVGIGASALTLAVALPVGLRGDHDPCEEGLGAPCQVTITLVEP